MEITAKLRNLRISARKVRLVVDMLRYKNVKDAQTILTFTVKKGAPSVLKLLRQAIANAKNNFQLDPDNLYIYKISVDDGPKIKRWRPRARGQAYEIQKKTCHINIVLKEIKKGKKLEKTETAGMKEEKAVKVEEAKGKQVKKERPSFRQQPEFGKSTAEGRVKRMFRRKSV
jgi:large subunit ribosomal protein L22